MDHSFHDGAYRLLRVCDRLSKRRCGIVNARDGGGHRLWFRNQQGAQRLDDARGMQRLCGFQSSANMGNISCGAFPGASKQLGATPLSKFCFKLLKRIQNARKAAAA